MLFWIKAAALADHIDHAKNPCSQLIEDSVRKLASAASKLQKFNLMPPFVFQSWEQIALRAKRLANETKIGIERRREKALTFPAQGIDLSQVIPVTLKNDVKDKSASANAVYIYPHSFSSDLLPLSELHKLSQAYIASLSDEMSYRLNFLRLLPNCTSFDYERDIATLGGAAEQKPFLTLLGSRFKNSSTILKQQILFIFLILSLPI